MRTAIGHLVLAVLAISPVIARAELAPSRAGSDERFKKDVRPILAAKCFSCHADGGDSGNVAFDKLEEQGKLLNNVDVWQRALSNVRAGLMPPQGEEKLTDAERATLEGWIKRDVFKIDPANQDPGRVTLHRLNRVEYRNTVRDLTGVNYNVDDAFPADDSGHGFDNMADVLTLSPMQLEKYIAAATAIVGEAVPTAARVPGQIYVGGARFQVDGSKGKGGDGGVTLSYYEPAKRAYTLELKQVGTFRPVLNFALSGRHTDDDKETDPNRCELVLLMDGKELFRKDFGWRGYHEYSFPLDEQKLEPGKHVFMLELKPQQASPSRIGEMKVQFNNMRLEGPLEPERWVKAKNHERWFGKEPIPTAAADRRTLAKKILSDFVTKAYRRPVDGSTVDRVVKLAESTYTQPGHTFESGVSEAMIAVLASPRFIFREELPLAGGERYPLVDEYSLASRLSYFFWSTSPDDELYRLAAAGELRKNLPAQVKRMLADGRAGAFVSNFAGQWLQSRDVETLTIERRRILTEAELDKANIKEDREFNIVRSAMRQETERMFAYIVKENRSLLELVDANYTFLNEPLAAFYGVSGVKGNEVRRVELPADSVRGGVLTMGTTLMVTSNPTRTSPVKRGLFLLENILGTPTPPPPPNIPALEASFKSGKGKTPSLRESLELHRSNPDCMSCHARLDPPGLALESFNAIGQFREKERGQLIDATGELATGEKFKDIRELKKILVANHRAEIYRCMTEKLLTYALGRGVEYYDTETVDGIVAGLEKDGGKFETLLNGVVNSPAFQRRRDTSDAVSSISERVQP